MHIMIGRTLGGATVATLQGTIVFILSLFVGFRPTGWELPAAWAIMFLMAILFTALGTAIASVLEDMQGFQLIMNFLVMPMFFLSGAVFPLDGVPKVLQIAARIDPVSYGIDAMRYILVGVSHFGIGLDLMVLLALTSLLLGIGSFLFSRIQI